MNSTELEVAFAERQRAYLRRQELRQRWISEQLIALFSFFAHFFQTQNSTLDTSLTWHGATLCLPGWASKFVATRTVPRLWGHASNWLLRLLFAWSLGRTTQSCFKTVTKEEQRNCCPEKWSKMPLQNNLSPKIIQNKNTSQFKIVDLICVPILFSPTMILT